MRAVLMPYGGDGQRFWAADTVGMAVNDRLTLPEDRFDREPALADDIVLAADVRLDNREDLARALDVDAQTRATMSDSAWLRLAWRRWGAGCLERLVGEFAFAVWDSRQRELCFAVDQLGRRPLFYSARDGFVAAASMPAALVAISMTPVNIDQESLARRLMVLHPPPGRSFFEGISVVLPGHCVRVSAAHVDVRAYHEFSRAQLRYRRDDDYVEHFREIFAAAVRCRLRAVGPLASSLSSGLDSGSVTALAARTLKEQGAMLTAVTWTPKPGALVPPAPGRIVDESRAAAACASMYDNIDHVAVHFADESPMALLSELAVMSGEPTLSPGNAPLFNAAGVALRERGCRVLLVGQAGNSNISYHGAPVLSALFRRGRLMRLASEVAGARRWGGSVGGSLYRAVAPSLPVGIARLVSRLSERHGVALSDYSAILPAFAARWAPAEVAGRGAGGPRLPAADSWAPRLHLIQESAVGAPRRKAAEAVYGYELRDPTADLRVIDFCLSIPDDQFRRNGQPRWLIRRAARGLLPDATVDGWQRGLQGSDWPRMVAPFRSDFQARLDDLSRRPLASEALDLEALRRLLDHWPAEWQRRHHTAYVLKLLRALAAAEFIRRCGSAADAGVDDPVG
jgi:asparagine synthase (glutamine-hydrolysing)